MNSPEKPINFSHEMSSLLEEADLKVKEKINLFNLSIQLLLDPSEPQSLIILATIKRHLLQFKIDDYYEPLDIFQEAYIRGFKKVIMGDEIPCLPAWIKLTALNIVREKFREKQKMNNLKEMYKSESELILTYNNNVNSTIDANVELLESAIKSLSKEDYNILKLHIIDGLSWRKIAEYLVSIKEELEVNELIVTRLRKRGQRALERLRQNYHGIIQTDDYKSGKG
ncbi:hypothetical protein RIVM261_076070 [Rivularia sp. IAM M-261]|nr:hypothetical protein RIVM261_076070 [Rivularia sp. IAM M-261]